jgi:long-chain acyl-CoA synthetase
MMTKKEHYQLPLERLKILVREHGDEVWLHQPTSRVWAQYTFNEVYDSALRIASGLKAQGINSGDRVAILAKNSAYWMIADFACMLGGFISVPIYATAGEDTISYVMEHSDSKAIFVGKLDDGTAADAVLNATNVIALPDYNLESRVPDHHWHDWLLRCEPLTDIHQAAADDTLTIAYTSGSTGKPKGVVLSHINLAAAGHDTADLLGEGDSERRVLSYLPMAHITERSIVTMHSLYKRLTIYFNEDLASFVEDLNIAKPSFFMTVPRLWAKFQSQVLSVIPDEQLQEMLKGEGGEAVAAGIRAKLGLSECSAFGSGTAPIPPGLLKWFRGIGIDIGEGWGMTETSGPACSNLPYHAERIGSIGVPLPCTDMKISDEGEILIRGTAIFKEYYKNPEATAETFIDDWMHTGDKGIQNDDGSFSIIGRVKEQFKTGKGKYVAPVPIECLIGAVPLIEQVCVVGSGRGQPMALAVLADLGNINKDDVRNIISSAVAELNAGLESHCRIDHIHICDEAWTIENNMLTPTMKLKRDILEAKYRHIIEGETKELVGWS